MARLTQQRAPRLGDDLAADFELAISGLDASKSTQLFKAVRPLIASVTYEEDEELAAQFVLEVINQPDDTFGRPVDWSAVIDSKAFQEGNSVDLWMGYKALEYMGRVDLVRWLPVFSPGGPTTFTIKGHDGRHKMMNSNQFKVKSTKARKRKTFYKNLPDELIVKKIAEKYGYGVESDTTETKKRQKGSKKGVFPTRPQPSDMTDWAFLQKLAEINRFDLWVAYSRKQKKNIIHFKKRRDAGNAEYLFTYNGDNGSLIEAEPDFAVGEQTTDVEVLMFDKRRRKMERSVISDPTHAEKVKLTTAGVGGLKAKKTISVGARVRFSAFGQSFDAFRDKPFRSKAEAETFVKNWLKERERDLLILRGRVVGLETLRPRQIHQIAGLGTRLDGFYRFTQVKHEMIPGSPYTCPFIATKVLSQELSRKKPTTKVQTTKTAQAGG